MDKNIVELLKTKEFIERVGITEKTLYRWLKDKKLTCYKIPGKKICYYDPNEVKKEL